MALRDQPYLPLYVDDFTTDEKLAECSAESTGVYVRIMCLMHKSEEYGVILLKQKDKQSGQQIRDFALKFAKHFPYDVATIERGLKELLDEGVLKIDGDKLSQKRMVHDNEVSIKRASAGSKGGSKTQKQIAKPFAKAKDEPKSVIVIEAVIEAENRTIDSFKEQFINDYNLDEKVSHENGFNPLQLRTAKFQFWNSKELDEEMIGKPYKDVQKHFINWARLNAKRIINGTGKQVGSKGHDISGITSAAEGILQKYSHL